MQFLTNRLHKGASSARRMSPPGNATPLRALLGCALLATLALSTTGCLRDERVVVLGSKAFTESYVWSSIASLLLEREGYVIQERFGVGSMIAREALRTGQIDLYPEYTGTAWTLYLGREEKLNDPQELYEKLRAIDREQNDIVWLDRSRVNNTYALALPESNIQKYGASLSALAAYNNRNTGALTFGVDHEFYERPDGFNAMIEHYGMQIDPSQVRRMDIGLTFESLKRGQIDVAMVYSTDGKLKQFDLQILEDDRNFFPIYNACFTVGAESLERLPELPRILRPVAEELDNASMQQLNYEVDALGKPALLVAREWLQRRDAREAQAQIDERAPTESAE